MISPHRILNEKSGFLGLSIWDMAGLAYLLIGLHSILAEFNIEWVSFFIWAALAYIVVSIRLRCRRKTVRDFFLYQLTSRGLLL